MAKRTRSPKTPWSQTPEGLAASRISRWHITHLPTGLLVARLRSREESREYLRSLQTSIPDHIAAGIARATELGVKPGTPNEGPV